MNPYKLYMSLKKCKHFLFLFEYDSFAYSVLAVKFSDTIKLQKVAFRLVSH